MKCRMLLAALAVTATYSMAAAEGTQQDTMKLQAYVDYLLNTYGANADVVTSNINGFDAKEKAFTDSFPGESRSVRESQIHGFATAPAAEQTCQALGRLILAEQTAGAYSYRWCWSNLQTGSPSVTYEAKRDTWIYQAGRLTYFVSSHYNCQSAGDLAAMPSAVKAARCYQ